MLAALVTLAALPAMAQQGGDDSQPQGQRRGQWARRGGQNNHMAELAAKLNLTDAQKQQFMQINRDTRKQVMAVHNDSSLSDDQKKEKTQDVRKQAHKQMFGILTPEQREKLKEMREQHQKDGDKNNGSAKDGEKKDGDKKDGGNAPGGQASGKKPDKGDDDPFAGMTSDDDDGPGSGD